jgi:charged multivesicular body protein 7
MTLLNAVLSQPTFKKSRLPSLYSDFTPLRVSNKDGYDANVDAWIQALNRSLLSETFLSVKRDTSTNDEEVKKTDHVEDPITSCLCITTNQTLADLLTSSQWGKPLALASVEQEAVAKRAWIPKELFMTQPESIYANPSRIANITFGAALRWGASKVWTPSTPKQLSGASYVVVANVEQVATKLLKQYEATMQESYAGHITTRTLFAAWCAKESPYRLSAADLEVLIQFLARDKGRLVQQSGQGKALKFLPAGTPLDEPGVSETDEAVAQLKEVTAMLDDQIEALSQRSTKLEREARAATSAGQKTLALSKLRSRKQLEASLQSRADQRAQAETILLKIDEAATNIGLMNAMEAGGLALDRMLKSLGGMERVDAIMDQVADSMAEADEIQQAISIGAVPALDEGEVEDAYERMLAQATEGVKTVRIDETPGEIKLDLPSVPNTPIFQEDAYEARESAESTGKEAEHA